MATHGIDVAELAREIILDHATDIEYMSIDDRVAHGEDTAHLSEGQQEEVIELVDRLIGLATIDVSFFEGV